MGRRRLLAVGTAHYVNRDDELPKVPEAIRVVRNCFESLDYTADTLLDPTDAAMKLGISAFLVDTAWKPDDVAVLYITGHGVPDAAGHYLLAKNTALNHLAATGVRADFVAECLGSAPRLAQLLVLLDTCYAGLATTDAVTLMSRMSAQWPAAGDSGRQYWLLGSARDRQEAYPIAFPSALADTISHLRTAFGSHMQYIGVDAVLEGVNRRMALSGAGHRAVQSTVGVEGGGRFFVNPSYRPYPVADGEREGGLLFPAGEFRAHWAPRARGVESASQPGSFFTGRTAALERVVRWLESPAEGSLLVLTGDPGSGKSAVAARIVLTSDAFLRAEAGLDDDEEPPVAPPGSVQVAVLARGKTAEQLREELQPACFGQAGSVAVVDAVDESADPSRVVSDVLEPLLASGVRIVAAARRRVAKTLPGGVVVDLDAPAYRDSPSVRLFVERVLTRTGSPYVGQRALAAEVAAVVAVHASNSFLLARVVATTLARGRTLLTASQVAEASRSWGSLVSAFDAELARFGEDVPRVRDLLTPLAWAYGAGLPWEGLWPAVATSLVGGLSFDDGDVAWLLNEAADLVVEDVESGRSVYRLFHEELARYLRRGDPRVTNSHIVDALRESVVTDHHGRADWAGAHPYVRNYLASHAVAGGRLAEFLRDPGYVVAAEPEALFAAVSASRSPLPDPAAATVLRAMDVLRDPTVDARASYVMLAAMIEREPALRDVGEIRRPWSPRWVNWSTGESSALLTSLGSPVRGLGLVERPAGSVLLVCAQDGMAQALDPLSGTVLWTIDLGEEINLAVSAADGSCLAVALAEGRVLGLGIEDGTVLWGFYHGDDELTALAAGQVADRLVLATGTYNEGLDNAARRRRRKGAGRQRHGVVRLWAVGAEPALLWERPTFGAGVRGLHLLGAESGASLLAAGDTWGEDTDSARAVRLLNLTDGSVAAEMPESEPAVMAIAEPIGATEVLVSTRKEVIRWSPAGVTTRAPHPYTSHRADQLLTLRHRDRSLAVLPELSQVHLIDGATLEPLSGQGAYVGTATRLAARSSSEGGILFTGDGAGQVRSWDLDSLLAGRAAARKRVLSAAVDESAGVVLELIDDGDRALESRNLAEGDVVRRLDGLTATIVVTASDPGLVLLAHPNGEIEARHVGDMETVWRARVHESMVTDLRAVGEVVVSTGFDGAVRCTALATGEPLCPPARVEGFRDKALTDVEVVGRDPTRVVAGGLYYGLVGWDLAALLEGSSDPLSDGDNAAPETVRIRAREDVAALGRLELGSREVLVCLEGGSTRVRLIDLADRRETGWTAHDHSVMAVASTNENVWTGDMRGVIRSWNVADLVRPGGLAPVMEVRIGAPIMSLHPVGNDALVAATSEGVVCLDVHVRG